MTARLGGNTSSVSLVAILLRVMDLRVVLLTLISASHCCLLLLLCQLNLLLGCNTLSLASHLLFYYRSWLLLLRTRLALWYVLFHINLLPATLRSWIRLLLLLLAWLLTLATRSYSQSILDLSLNCRVRLLIDYLSIILFGSSRLFNTCHLTIRSSALNLLLNLSV
jgi:hypothetical protein